MRQKKQKPVPISQFDNVTFTLDQLALLDFIAEGASLNYVSRRARKILKNKYNNGVYRKLALGINDSCNLTCGHCYYASTHDKSVQVKRNLLDQDDWKSVVENAVAAGVNHFSISGKEPLLSQKITFKILQAMEEAKKDGFDIKYELFTNGTLLGRMPAEIGGYHFSPLIVSFDGFREKHDQIRGTGTYEMAKQGVIYARHTGIRDIAATFTATPENVDSLDKMIDDLSQCGIQKFGIGFCFPRMYNKSHVADIGIFDRVREKISDFCDADRSREIDISTHLSVREHPELVAQLYTRGEITDATVIVPKQKIPRLVMPFGRGNAVLSIDLLPTVFYNRLRVECDGAVSGDYDMVTSLQARTGFADIGHGQCYSFDGLWSTAEEQWVTDSINHYRPIVQAFQLMKNR